MTMKILLPLDGSEQSLRAVEHVISKMGWYKETPELHLLHVHLPIPVGRIQAHVSKETLEGYYREEGRALMSAAEERLNAAGVAFVSHIHVGQPAEVIVREVAALACDLIVMGTHGRGGVAGLVIGSVASRVVHLAACPVLLVK